MSASDSLPLLTAASSGPCLRRHFDANVRLTIAGASSTRSQQTLASAAADEEHRLYGLMTLLLQRLIVCEPSFDEDELDSAAISSSHITAGERSDIRLYRGAGGGSSLSVGDGFLATDLLGGSMRGAGRRRRGFDPQPSMPVSSVPIRRSRSAQQPAPSRSSSSSSDSDAEKTRRKQKGKGKAKSKSDGGGSSDPSADDGPAAVTAASLLASVEAFDAHNLSLVSGRKMAVDGIAIILDLRRLLTDLEGREIFAIIRRSGGGWGGSHSPLSPTTASAAEGASFPLRPAAHAFPPTYRCRRRLYQIVQSYAVYANKNIGVRNEMASNVRDLLAICFAFKGADEGWGAACEEAEEEADASRRRGAAAPPVGGGGRQRRAVDSATIVRMSFIDPASPCSPSARIPLEFPTLDPSTLPSSPIRRRRGALLNLGVGIGLNSSLGPDDCCAPMSPTFAMNASFSADPLSTPPSAFRRRTEEISILEAYLADNNVPAVLAEELCQCYALEMLVDAGMPPAVCSSRYEGVATILWERRGRLVGTIIASKSVLTLLLKAMSVQQLAFLMRLGLCVEPRGRARFYDRLVSEGGLGLLLRAARDGSRLGEVLNVLATITLPCGDGGGGRVLAEGMDAGGAEGRAGSTPLRRGRSEEGKSPSPSPSPSSSSSSSSATKTSAKCTAWAANPQTVCELLLVLCAAITKPKGGVKGGQSHQNTIVAQQRSDPTLAPRMAEVLENIVCFSRHTAEIAVGVIGGVLAEAETGVAGGSGRGGPQQRASGPPQAWLPMLFPAMVMYVRRKEAAEQAAMIGNWLDTVAAAIVACVREAAAGRYSSAPSRRFINARALSAAVGPYLGFVRALLEETQWREGIDILLKRAKYACDVLLSARPRPSGGANVYPSKMYTARPSLGSAAALHVLALVEPLMMARGLLAAEGDEGDAEGAGDGGGEAEGEEKEADLLQAKAHSHRPRNAPPFGLGYSLPSSPVIPGSAAFPSEASDAPLVGTKRSRSRSPPLSASPPRTYSAHGRTATRHRSPRAWGSNGDGDGFADMDVAAEENDGGMIVHESGLDESDTLPSVRLISPLPAPRSVRFRSGAPPCLFGTGASPPPEPDVCPPPAPSSFNSEEGDPIPPPVDHRSPSGSRVRAQSDEPSASDRVFYSLSRTPHDAAAEPIATVVPYRARMERDLATHTAFADRSLDDDEDGFGFDMEGLDEL